MKIILLQDFLWARSVYGLLNDQNTRRRSLSGVLDLANHNQEDNAENPMDQVVFNAFGGEKLVGTMHDIFHLAKVVDQMEGKKPKLYLACGKEDFLFDHNLRFKQLTDQLSLDIETTFDSGERMGVGSTY